MQQPPRSTSKAIIWALVALAVVVVLGVGGCVALVVTARSELGENEASVVERDEAPGVTTGTVPPGGSEGSAPGATGGAGTRDAPLPIGSEVDLGNGWRIRIVSANVGPDATAAVLAGNEFNAPPAAGKRYIIIEISASFDGSSTSATESPFFGFDLSVFGSDDVERSSVNGFVTAPDPVLDQLSELAAGGNATGNIALEVGAEESGLVARLEPALTFDATQAWIALG